MPAQVSELKVRDVPIRLHRAGRGPTVLFLHGAGGVPQCCRSWLSPRGRRPSVGRETTKAGAHLSLVTAEARSRGLAVVGRFDCLPDKRALGG
jgi:hypothetical protein